jgi:protein tyrosine phosphatase (PTP) superfamily phosphohydrolase (DUF442 family)
MRHLILFAAAAATALATGCRSTTKQEHAAAPAVTIAPPAPTDGKAANLAGLHNVVTYAPNVVCGGVPEGEEGLHTLAAMGIKTIVSVDGATPDVATAEKLGMHYIHLPISYNGITQQRQKELAQAVVNADGPVYMHCHHGKHRSASALATALVQSGKLTTAQAVERMKVSGTAENYQGLWQAARDSKPLDASELKADLSKFPSIAKVSGMVAMMAEIDSVFENVTAAQKAGWAAPKDHPDLVPQKESKRLQSLFGQLENDAESKAHPADYQQMLGKSLAAAKALDAAVAAGDKAAADAQYQTIQKSCKECHKVHRDN